jgi:hypothetical protein
MYCSLLTQVFEQSVEDLAHANHGHGKTRLIPLGLFEQTTHLLSELAVTYTEVSNDRICIENVVFHRSYSRLRSARRSSPRLGFNREFPETPLQRVDCLEVVRFKNKPATLLQEHYDGSFSQTVSLSQIGGNDNLSFRADHGA